MYDRLTCDIGGTLPGDLGAWPEILGGDGAFGTRSSGLARSFAWPPSARSSLLVLEFVEFPNYIRGGPISGSRPLPPMADPNEEI